LLFPSPPKRKGRGKKKGGEGKRREQRTALRIGPAKLFWGKKKGKEKGRRKGPGGNWDIKKIVSRFIRRKKKEKTENSINKFLLPLCIDYPSKGRGKGKKEKKIANSKVMPRNLLNNLEEREKKGRGVDQLWVVAISI